VTVAHEVDTTETRRKAGRHRGATGRVAPVIPITAARRRGRHAARAERQSAAARLRYLGVSPANAEWLLGPHTDPAARRLALAWFRDLGVSPSEARWLLAPLPEAGPDQVTVQ
jgi:hypothetical protein